MLKFVAWCDTFKGALCLACLAVFAMFMELSGDDPSPGWAVFDGVCCLYWVWVARRAIKGGNLKSNVQLTPDQRQRIKEATDNLGAVLREVDREITTAQRALKEQSDVQSDKRTDQEDGSEGDD